MIVEIATGVGGFIAGLAFPLGYGRLRRRRRSPENRELEPDVEAAIESAAKEWASTQTNPYAEEVARPWVESFVRTGLVDGRIVRRRGAGASE